MAGVRGGRERGSQCRLSSRCCFSKLSFGLYHERERTHRKVENLETGPRQNGFSGCAARRTSYQAGPGLSVIQSNALTPRNAPLKRHASSAQLLPLAPVTVTVYHNDARRLGAA